MYTHSNWNMETEVINSFLSSKGRTYVEDPFYVRLHLPFWCKNNFNINKKKRRTQMKKNKSQFMFLHVPPLWVFSLLNFLFSSLLLELSSSYITIPDDDGEGGRGEHKFSKVDHHIKNNQTFSH